MPLSKVPATALASGAARTNFGAGAVLQVVNAYSSGSMTTTSNAYVVVSGLSVAITIQANSRILVLARSGVYGGGGSSSWATTGRIAIYKDGTMQALSEHQGPISASEQAQQHSLTHLSSSLSAGTYTYDIRGQSTVGGSIVFNRDGSSMGQLTLLEIAG
jgi:hypothetical protein